MQALGNELHVTVKILGGEDMPSPSLTIKS